MSPGGCSQVYMSEVLYVFTEAPPTASCVDADGGGASFGSVSMETQVSPSSCKRGVLHSRTHQVTSSNDSLFNSALFCSC